MDALIDPVDLAKKLIAWPSITPASGRVFDELEEAGETLLRPGDIATFPRDAANGHHLVNRSNRACTFVAIDNSEGEGNCHYPDVDLVWNMGDERYTHRDGTPY